MAILFIKNDKNCDAWLEAFEAFPEIEVFTPETVVDPNSITMAITWKAPKGSFDNYPNLKVVGSMGAGVDHLFEDPSLPKNVILTRVVDDKLSSDMQEFVLSLCLQQIKNLGSYSQLQSVKKWEPRSYQRVADVNVGILGLGTLGQAVGEMLLRVGFKVSGWSKSKKEITGVKSYDKEGLDEFLSQSQILICLLPLTNNTRHILNKTLFDKLPKGAYLINVARGGHLNDDDLLQSLDNGQLSGAALDVFHKEPLPEEHKFWDRKDILITPHVASMSNAASVAPQVAENYKRMERGQKLLHQVSREKEY